VRVSLSSLDQTQALAQRIARHLEVGDVLLLKGDLGTGKSTFVRFLLQAKGHKGDVPSPTFTLMQSYDLPDLQISHFDFYRLKTPEEIEEIGFDEAIADGAVIVEWPDKAASFMPHDALELTFVFNSEQGRFVDIEALSPRWIEKLNTEFAHGH
jgi:tRNA threonylcarbamoyl adenosine modification protein YjeE